jgi:hypothetical protein
MVSLESVEDGAPELRLDEHPREGFITTSIDRARILEGIHQLIVFSFDLSSVAAGMGCDGRAPALGLAFPGKQAHHNGQGRSPGSRSFRLGGSYANDSHLGSRFPQSASSPQLLFCFCLFTVRVRRYLA